MIASTMPASAIAVSNHFIELAKGDSSLTPMKLQKILYYAHGWHLALANEPLIQERIEAWKYGPVVPVVYHKFKEFGNGAITSLAKVLDWNSPSLELVVPKINPTSPSTTLLNRVWEIYGKYSAVQLSNATHQPGTPWQITWDVNGGKDRPGTDIPDELIKEHFEKLASKA